MTSRFLEGLEARIAGARDPREQACLRAERASRLARLGRTDEARAELTALHAKHDNRPDAGVSAWISLAEGLLVLGDHDGATARDKLKRALALGQAVGARRLTSIASAWLAQIDFSGPSFEPMVTHLALALRTADDDPHAALSCASVVAASALHWAGRFDLARPWYNRARHHATAEGDDPTLSALMHSMAWFRTVEARRLSVRGTGDGAAVREAELAAESIERFDRMTGMAAAGSRVPLLRAQVLLLREHYAPALGQFEAIAVGPPLDGRGGSACTRLADAAWCHLQLANRDAAARDARAAAAQIGERTPLEDRAMTHSRLALLHAALGDAATARSHQVQADTHWAAHAARQAELVVRLAVVLEPLAETAFSTPAGLRPGTP